MICKIFIVCQKVKYYSKYAFFLFESVLLLPNFVPENERVLTGCITKI